MPTANERKALGFLVFLALSGGAVRVWRAGAPSPRPSSTAALDHQLTRVDSARRARDKAGGKPKPRPKAASAPAGQVDMDRAVRAEIESLPGIGPSLAARIVAHRDSAGPFGSMDALCEVRGVGKAMAARLSPLVTFTAPRRPVSSTCGGGSKSSRKTRKPRTGELR